MKPKCAKTFLLLISFWPAATDCAAQKPEKNRLPRVGLIKNVEAASKNIPADCGNFYLFLKSRGLPEGYIFIAGPEGLDASMNLDGKDTRLDLLKTTRWYRAHGVAFRHEYRAGDLIVAFSFEPLEKYVNPYPTKIVLRKGRASRTIRAFGYPQCD